MYKMGRGLSLLLPYGIVYSVNSVCFSPTLYRFARASRKSCTWFSWVLENPFILKCDSSGNNLETGKRGSIVYFYKSQMRFKMAANDYLDAMYMIQIVVIQDSSDTIVLNFSLVSIFGTHLIRVPSNLSPVVWF